MDDVEIDVNAAADSIGADLGFGQTNDTTLEEDLDQPQQEQVQQPEQAAPIIRPVPKSWAKEYHDHWTKIDPKVQEYVELREKQMLDGLNSYKEHNDFGRQLREVFTPFQPMLQQHQISEADAVKSLLGAHYRLTNGTPESRKAAYEELGRNLGLTAAQAQQAAQPDPAAQKALEKAERLERELHAERAAKLNETKAKIQEEVDRFKADPAHQYFDEVEEDMIPLLNAGLQLKDAYERAVWANPVTRAKELARAQTETEKKLRENHRLDALKARKATSSNVNSRDTKKAPTEPLGTMEDTMRDTLRDISTRTH